MNPASAVLAVLFILAGGGFLALTALFVWLGRRARRLDRPAGLWRGLAAGSAGAGIVLLLALAAITIGMRALISSFPGGRGYGDAELFVPASWDGPQAIVVLPESGAATLTVMVTTADRPRELRCETTDGRFVVPAGDVLPVRLALTATDAGGREWRAESWLVAGGDTGLQLAPGSETVLPAGLPLRATVKVGYAAGSDQVGLEPLLTDEFGNEYSVTCADRAETIGFEVLDAAGAVAWRGDFEYG